MTILEIRDYVRTYLDVDSDDIPDNLLNEWIKKGFDKIVNQRQTWRGYETDGTLDTVADTQDYDLPFIGEIEQVYGPDGPIALFSNSKAERFFDAGQSTEVGIPLAYSFWNAQVRFWPTPDGVYTFTFRGIRKPTSPQNQGDNDTPDLPNDEASNILLDFVLAQANVQQDDFEKAQWYVGQYQDGLKELAAADSTAEPYSPVVVNGRRTRVGVPGARWPRGF